MTDSTDSGLYDSIYEPDFNKVGSFDHATETFDLLAMNGVNRHASYLLDESPAASICFGGVGSIWSMMTLYILASNGDIYTICPFLPTQWYVLRVFVLSKRH
jgi:hypothetical protein